MSDTLATNPTQSLAEPIPPPKKKPFYMTLWGQVLIGVALAIIYGYFKPASAIKMKPLGDGFIRLITMVITRDYFLHGRHGHRRHGEFEESRQDRRKGAAVLRDRVHAGALHRDARRQRAASGLRAST